MNSKFHTFFENYYHYLLYLLVHYALVWFCSTPLTHDLIPKFVKHRFKFCKWKHCWSYILFTTLRHIFCTIDFTRLRKMCTIIMLLRVSHKPTTWKSWRTSWAHSLRFSSYHSYNNEERRRPHNAWIHGKMPWWRGEGEERERWCMEYKRSSLLMSSFIVFMCTHIYIKISLVWILKQPSTTFDNCTNM